MQLRDIPAVSVLSSELKRTKEQIKAFDSASYKKGSMITLWERESLSQLSFNVELDDAFVVAVKEALARRITSIEEQIKSYGVQL